MARVVNGKIQERCEVFLRASGGFYTDTQIGKPYTSRGVALLAAGLARVVHSKTHGKTHGSPTLFQLNNNNKKTRTKAKTKIETKTFSTCGPWQDTWQDTWKP